MWQGREIVVAHGRLPSPFLPLSAIVYFMKRVKDCKYVSITSSQDGQVYSVCLCTTIFLVSTTVFSQNINKQNMNIADETFTDYSFLSRYHYTKSKN